MNALAGFAMLNMVREYRNDICSVLMTDLDKIKIDRHTQDANSLIHPHTLHQLNTEELKACEWIYKEKIRIEQERINSSYVEKMIEDTSTLIFSDTVLIESLYTGIEDYVRGEKSVKETVKTIQKKVTVYLNEAY